MKTKLINACKTRGDPRDERSNRKAIYFIIIETTLKDNEAPVGVGYFILIKSGGPEVFPWTGGDVCPAQPRTGVGTGSGNWEHWALPPPGVSGEGIFLQESEGWTPS